MKIEIKPYDDSFIAVSFPEGFNTGLFNVDNISPYKEQKPAEPVGSIKRK